MRTQDLEDMKQFAAKRAKTVMQQLEKGLNRDDFEYEFNNIYPHSDFMVLDMDELFKLYDNQ